MRNRFILIFSISILVTSCFDPSKPNFQYFPDMYESLAYETYAESEAFSNGIEAQLPPEGSIARGWEPYDYEDSNEGYELAKSQLVSPLEVNDYNRNTYHVILLEKADQKSQGSLGYGSFIHKLRS